MAHLWVSKMNEWKTRELSGDSFQLPAAGAGAGALLRRAANGAPEGGWLLLASPGMPVLVNGAPVQLGIRALRDRDEIRPAGAAPMFFSTEQLMAIEPFTGLPEGKCPRCTRTIEPQSPAVRCAGCKTWYHSTEARSCFCYGEGPICVVCGADAVVSGDYAWTPEGH